jgi:hypothetical protein
MDLGGDPNSCIALLPRMAQRGYVIVAVICRSGETAPHSARLKERGNRRTVQSTRSNLLGGHLASNQCYLCGFRAVSESETTLPHSDPVPPSLRMVVPRGEDRQDHRGSLFKSRSIAD